MPTSFVHIQLRRKTAATWTSTDEVLLAGEPGVELDTGRWKLGNGTTGWQALPYMPSPGSPIIANRGSFTPTHSTLATIALTPDGGDTRWDGSTWTGPSQFLSLRIKMRLNDGAGSGANIGIGFNVAGTNYITWRSLGTVNRETLTGSEVAFLTTGDALTAVIFVDNASDVGMQECQVSISAAH